MVEISTIIERVMRDNTKVREEYDGEWPNQSGQTIIQRAADLDSILMQLERHRGSNEPVPEEQYSDMIEMAVTDLIFTIGEIEFEYDVNIEAAIEERLTMMEQYDSLQDGTDVADVMDELESESVTIEFEDDSDDSDDFGGLGAGGLAP